MTNNLCALLMAVALIGGTATAAPPTISPLVGEWTLDTTTLPMPPEVRPQRVDLTFSDGPDGKWSTQVEIVDAKGMRMHSASTVALDGTPGRATGTYWVDVIAAALPPRIRSRPF